MSSLSTSAQRSGRVRNLGYASSSQPVRKGQPKGTSQKRNEALKSSDKKNKESRPTETNIKHNVGAIQPHRRLVAQTRLITLKAMTSKWVPLEQEALAAIQTVLADCARPVLSHLGRTKGLNSERRHEQSRIAITATTRRLRSKLVKGIPFPVAARHNGRALKTLRHYSSSREPEFDFERTLECMKALEQQLDPLQHSITLLEGQRKRDELTLEADYAALRQLEANAQAETRTWRDRIRRLHVLAPGDGKFAQAGMEMPEKPGNSWKSDVYEDTDKRLLALSTQLGSHMESLRSNLQQIQDVGPTIAQSKAALEQFLHSHLNNREYELVVLGD